MHEFLSSLCEVSRRHRVGMQTTLLRKEMELRPAGLFVIKNIAILSCAPYQTELNSAETRTRANTVEDASFLPFSIASLYDDSLFSPPSISVQRWVNYSCMFENSRPQWSQAA